MWAAKPAFDALLRCGLAALLLAAMVLFAAPKAEAQTAGTVTLSATGNNGDRDATAPGLQVNEGDEITVTATANGLTAGGVRIRYNYAGTAASVTDYHDLRDSARVDNSDILDFVGGGNAITEFTIRDDTIAEADETIIITVVITLIFSGTMPSSFTSTDTLTVTILANDGASVASVGGTDTEVGEGATINVPVELRDTVARTAASTVAFAITGTATSADYTVDDSGSDITFNATAATGTITVAQTDASGFIPVTITGDSDSDDGETLVITLTGHTGGGAGVTGFADSAARTYTLSDSDSTPPVFVQDDQPGWSGGQSVLYLQADEDFKILPHPAGGNAATLPVETPSATTLDARDFTLTENPGANEQDIAVQSVEALPQHRAFRLTLGRAIADVQTLRVVYQRVGANAIYDTAPERNLAQNGRRNAMTSQTLSLAADPAADADSDGIPDAVEARIATDAGNPFVDVTEAQQPAFSISRTASQEPIAYSGIRADGVRAHLGVATTGQAAAQTLTAYYRSDTFGHDGTYQCAGGQFPANYAAPLAAGGCAPVDWGNIVPAMNHTIAWLAISREGVWAVNLATDSNLPEQTIYRIPELNMASQRLFTTGAAVTVRATADDGRSFTASASAGGVWTMDQVVSGSSISLWRPSATPPTANDYSVGLTTQTVVVVVTAGSVIPPVPGSPLLMRGSDVVNALAEGSAHELHIPLDNGGVITTETHAIAAAGIAGLAGAVTDVAVRLPGGGGSIAAVFRYPVVSATNNPLASSGDEDGDGIADMLDDFDGLAQLPVSATEVVRHIRPALRSHRLRAGDETLARVAAADTVDYRAWQASEFTAGSVVYDFTIYEVDYASVSSATPVGGMAGVIIPLPQAFRGAGVEVFKVGRGAFDRSGGDRYGFAMRRAEDGGCPDDADGLYSLSSGDCLAVYVTDGGPNDDDGAVNGVIKDPLGVRIGGGGGSSGGGGSGSGGGSSGAFGPVALLALMVLAALLLLSASRLRRRRIF